MQMFGELHAGGATVCLATHDPHGLRRRSGTFICSTAGWWDRLTAEDAAGRATH